MSIKDVATIQPGLGRLMPEVGARTWKLYYAAQAENWPLAAFQAKEIKGLMELGAFTRPKHADALNKYLEKIWKPVQDAINDQNFAAFEAAFTKAVDAGRRPILHVLRCRRRRKQNPLMDNVVGRRGFLKLPVPQRRGRRQR